MAVPGDSAMVDLEFAVVSARVETYAASPLLVFKLKVTNKTPATPVQNLMLNCQIRIEPTRRRYGASDYDRLLDLFGEPERWGQTLHGFLWAHTFASTPPFSDDCMIDLPVPCSYDFNIAATKYFYGLKDGEVPLLLLFNGTVFYHDDNGQLQAGQIPWSNEASFRLPVNVWQSMMDLYYPDSAWLRLSRVVFEQLYRYKRHKGLPTFELALQALLDEQTADTRP
jgi:hypothetical protein